MSFEKFHMGMYYDDKKQSMIDRLWLWYSFNTEMFDKNLASSIPSPNDPDSVILGHPADKSLATRHALRLKQQMMDIASINDISLEELNAGKRYIQHMKMKEVVNRYLSLVNRDGLDFIFTALQEKARMKPPEMDRTPIKHAIECACVECREQKGFQFSIAHEVETAFDKGLGIYDESEPSMEERFPYTTYDLVQRVTDDRKGLIYSYKKARRG